VLAEYCELKKSERHDMFEMKKLCSGVKNEKLILAIVLLVSSLMSLVVQAGDIEKKWQQYTQQKILHYSQSLFPFHACFEAAASKHKLPVTLILSVAKGESNFDEQAVSNKGAVGIMQIQYPQTAAHLGITDKAELFEPCKNIFAGTRYLSDLYDKYNNWHYALAAYNYGPSRIRVGEELPEGAVWYSNYIYQHLSKISEDHLTTLNVGSYVSAFNKEYRANAMVDILNKNTKDKSYYWFDNGQLNNRYIVYKGI